MLYQNTFSTPMGPMVCVADEHAVFSLDFEDCLKEKPSVPKGNQSFFQNIEDQLTKYFEGALFVFTIPLACEGTIFQKRVWDALKQIPYGATWSYKTQAESLSCASYRAVGTANGKNPVCILVPCHRVIASSGALGGYRGGLSRKQWLLQHEKNHAPTI